MEPCALERRRRITAVVGGLWLVALFALDYLRLPQPDLPEIGNAPLPTVLLIGGLLAGALLALLARPIVASGAGRRRRAARRELRAAVEQVATRRVVEPMAAELDAHERFCQAMAAAQDRTPARSQKRRR